MVQRIVPIGQAIMSKQLRDSSQKPAALITLKQVRCFKKCRANRYRRFTSPGFSDLRLLSCDVHSKTHTAEPL